MSKRHFIALADALRKYYQSGELTPNVLSAIVEFCKRQNPAFKSCRWIDYLKGVCGPNGGTIKKAA